MMWLIILLPLLAATCLAEQMGFINACSVSTTPPSCTLTFSPSAPAQNSPTTTLYKAIVTTSLNTVDCPHCTVVNVQNNAIAQGPFTANTTEEIVTVVRAACIPEDTVSTRGSQDNDDINAEKQLPPCTRQASDLDKRVAQSEQNLALDFADIVDPGNWTVMQSIQIYRRQCYSAFVAVSLIISGADPQLLCNLTRSPELQLSLSNKGLDGQQVADLICFWSVFGYHFNVSVFQVLDILATAATSFTYAIQYGLNSTQDVIRMCGGLDLQDDLYDMLHIDSQGIYTVLCSSTVNATSTSTYSSTISAFVSETVSASSGEIVWTSWGSNGTVLITATAGGFSWSNQIGTGSASATFGGSRWSTSGEASSTSAGGTAEAGSSSSGWGINATAGASGAPWPTGVDFNTTATFDGTAGSNSWSSRWESNTTASSASPVAPEPISTFSSNGTIVVVGPGSAPESAVSPTNFTDGNGTVLVSDTTVIQTNAPSWTLSNATDVVTKGSADATGASFSWSTSITTGHGWTSTFGPINATGLPVPTLSWTTFTDANGSIIVSGSAATTVASSFAWSVTNRSQISTATGLATGSSWSSAVGNISTSSESEGIVSYTGLAWTSWIVSSRPTAAIITGTAGTISWGINTATATITGSEQVATFTVIQVTKTIIVVATAVGQTWTAWGTSGGGVITGVGTAGTWTLDSAITSLVNGSSIAATASVITETWKNATASRGKGNGTATATWGASMISGGIPVITATGARNITSTVVGTAVTSMSGNTSAVTNVTELITGLINTTTTITGEDIPPGVATIGTGPVTTNSENITFSIVSSNIGTISSEPANESAENITFSILPWSSSKFSYPAWTTNTASSSV